MANIKFGIAVFLFGLGIMMAFYYCQQESIKEKSTWSMAVLAVLNFALSAYHAAIAF